MGRKEREAPTVADVKAQELDPVSLGRKIGYFLSLKGFCVIDPQVEEEHLDNVLGDISAVDEQGRFASVPGIVLEEACLAKRDLSGWLTLGWHWKTHTHPSSRTALCVMVLLFAILIRS
ncbi:unnamed protein product [Effrenium voratum]|uniref:Uncharacterized protein n=1 Tax=Effrenium voratum TaxID=2562239 RepID=A0AA36HT65_9DINO|nr:unnamed protein product [Effrenium voratum]